MALHPVVDRAMKAVLGSTNTRTLQAVDDLFPGLAVSYSDWDEGRNPLHGRYAGLPSHG